jgi:hypothetical protein
MIWQPSLCEVSSSCLMAAIHFLCVRERERESACVCVCVRMCVCVCVWVGATFSFTSIHSRRLVSRVSSYPLHFQELSLAISEWLVCHRA